MNKQKQHNRVTRAAYPKKPSPEWNSVRLVTSKQLIDGYWERIGMMTYKREFSVIRDNGDGTYVVSEPTFKPRKETP